ncbi:MAG: MBL fold metallo-hydrolase [Asgard group archaeon]|nr:MBL fold metallo-hydrolase [Asgard group archaeon]
MQVTLTNIVDNTVRIKDDYIPTSGLSYLLEIEGRKILFDAGDNGNVLIHHMKLLDIDPNEIELLILSHGHWDHTHGLRALMYQRDTKKKLKIIAHPHSFRKRRVAKFLLILPALIKYRMYNYGFPRLPKELQEMLILEPTVEPYEVTPFLKTTGEISDRKEKTSTIDKLKIKEGRRFIKDSQLDDLSLVLKTKEGVVLILGCGHSGVLNICARAKGFYPNDKIVSIIGGTHLVALKTESELEYVAKILEEKYDKPLLYFSHCTGKIALKFFEKRFGKETVKSFMVGDKLTFDC